MKIITLTLAGMVWAGTVAAEGFELSPEQAAAVMAADAEALLAEAVRCTVDDCGLPTYANGMLSFPDGSLLAAQMAAARKAAKKPAAEKPAVERVE